MLYRQSVALPSPRSGAWHQRVPVVRIARGWARDRFFRLLETVAKTDDARAIVHGTLDDSVACRPAVPAAALRSTVRPYADLGHAAAAAVERHPVFITARFRSGSTLLWNLFRHTNRCTAFYEPLNERRWFDPSQRGTTTDATHKGVDDYWREYDGLEELGRYYNEEWTSRGLYMDAGSWNPARAAYVRLLVQRAPQRPVLQFNRIDFRLPWFRRMFPSASLIHLYRHPRDQWCSSLADRACSTSCTIADFRNHDGFYLLTWAADLKYRFPFLEQPETSHPYRLFYLIW